jgi:hypothetical protein
MNAIISFCSSIWSLSGFVQDKIFFLKHLNRFLIHSIIHSFIPGGASLPGAGAASQLAASESDLSLTAGTHPGGFSDQALGTMGLAVW